MYSLSVVIPNYNNAKYLERCLDSVLAQTRQPDEIIVVDDVSTDHSRDIIRRYEEKDNRVIGIYLEKNGGVSHARNVGLRAASSEYVTALDADDVYFNNQKLENEMTLIEKHGGNALAYSKLVYIDENDSIIRYVDLPKRLYYEGDIYHKYLIGMNEKLFIRDYCFPRKLMDQYPDICYDESKNLFEDLDFLIKLLKVIPAYCTFDYGTGYRIKNSGLSHRSESEIYAAKEKVYVENISRLEGCSRACILTCHKIANGISKTRKFVREKRGRR